VVFGLAAWIISLYSNIGCSSVKFVPQANADVSALEEATGMTLPTPLPDVNLGLWSHKGLALYQDIYGNVYVANTCLYFDTNVVDIDAKWKTAQAFAIIAIFFGLFATILHCVMPVWEVARKRVRLMTFLWVFVTFCQGLTLLQLSSNMCKNPFGGMAYEDTCQAAPGIKTNIAAVVLYACAGICCLFIKTKEEEEDEGTNVVVDEPKPERVAPEDEDTHQEEHV